MFTLPPRPPKDFLLKDVPKTQASAQEHTPIALPRVTQSNLAKFSSPVEPNYEDAPDKNIEIVNPKVLDKWTKQARASWVDRPEENAYFLYDAYKKYSVVVDPDYDMRYKHKPGVFSRSYKFETDCLEVARMKKLEAKTLREEEEAEQKRNLKKRDDKSEDKTANAGGCKNRIPPFWWRESKLSTVDYRSPYPSNLCVGSSTYRTSYKRWQGEPEVLGQLQRDACQRREALSLFGQPFQHEACTWYFKNYPPPNITFRPEKFSQ